MSYAGSHTPGRGSAGTAVGRALVALGRGLVRSVVAPEESAALPFDDGLVGGLRTYGARAWLALRWMLATLVSGLSYFVVAGAGALFGAADSIAPVAVGVALVVLVGVVNPGLLRKVTGQAFRLFVGIVVVTSLLWLLWDWLVKR